MATVHLIFDRILEAEFSLFDLLSGSRKLGFGKTHRAEIIDSYKKLVNITMKMRGTDSVLKETYFLSIHGPSSCYPSSTPSP